jgi:hypothetical protein
MSVPPFPWYEPVIQGSESVFQGDILASCPIIYPDDNWRPTDPLPEMNVTSYEVIVLSQSCDMEPRADGKAALDQVLLCRMHRVDEFEKKLDLKSVRDGKQPQLYLLAPCDLPGSMRGLRVVDFRRIFSLPLGFVRDRLRAGDHIRLLPPYREHLSQAFARVFMRVGLPANIAEEDLKRVSP